MTLVLLAGVLLGLLAGCGPKFTKLNYDTVYVGAPQDKVIRTIGEPTRKEGPKNETWFYVNDMPYYDARITFKDGVVARKNFSFDRPRRKHSEDHP